MIGRHKRLLSKRSISLSRHEGFLRDLYWMAPKLSEKIRSDLKKAEQADSHAHQQKVLLAVAGSDVHIAAATLINYFLSDHGIQVINLGACTTPQGIATAFCKYAPLDGIVISSLNGHAQSDLKGWKSSAAQTYNITSIPNSFFFFF